jgi:hypothetical protein
VKDYMTAAEIDALNDEPTEDTSEVKASSKLTAPTNEARWALEALGVEVEEAEEEEEPEPLDDDTEEAPVSGPATPIQKALGVEETGVWDVRTQLVWEEILEASDLPGKHVEALNEDWDANAELAGLAPGDDGMISFIESVRAKQAEPPREPRLPPPDLIKRPPTPAQSIAPSPTSPTPKTKRGRRARRMKESRHD